MKEEDLKNDVQLLPLRNLRAGEVTASYEAGRLRYIGCNGYEAVRMIFYAMRDENWVTFPMKISDETIVEKERSFEVRYRGSINTEKIKFEADFSITGNADGTIVFYMEGRALNSFQSKRNGLGVHHPVHACAGRPVEIIHPGDVSEKSVFPKLISPTRPFKDVTGMRYTTAYGTRTEIVFEGDEFEMEDQRNWSDDSFKTYSGPQYKTPMLDVREGDTMFHRITVRLNSTNTETIYPKQQVLQGPFPEIGYGFSDGDDIPTTGEQITTIPHGHLSVEVMLSDKKWRENLQQRIARAGLTNIDLRLLVYFTEFSEKETAGLSAFINDTRMHVTSVLVLSEHGTAPEADNYHIVLHELRKACPNLKIGFGNATWFANINATINREVNCDFTGFVVNPQVHQTDERSILENLLSQHTILDTLRDRVGEKPVQVHFQFSKVDDPRWHTQLGAWWLLNAIASMASAGVITICELTGRNAIFRQHKEHSPLMKLLKTLSDFAPVHIRAERMLSVADPMSTIRSAKVILENAEGEAIAYTMTDI
jgi:hypothetical protein